MNTCFPDGLARHLEGFLAALGSRRAIQHAVIAIESDDRSLRWCGAVGRAGPSGAPMCADTPFFIASVDKLFTATAVLKLCERRQVALDDPIAKHLPRASIEGLHRLRGIDYTAGVTIQHLLGHTSGLPDWLVDRPARGPSVLQRLLGGDDMSMSIETLVDLVRAQLSPHFPPQPPDARRQKLRYSDTNFMLLIAIIEAVTGRALHEVYDEFFFQPLSLRHTWLAGSEPPDRTPEPALLRVGDRSLEIPLLLRSTRAVYSTVADQLKFLRALVGGKVFDKPSTFVSMQQRWNRFGVPLDREALQLPSWPIEYGLGIMRYQDPVLCLLRRLAPGIVTMNSAAVIGHTGSTGSWLFHCPAMKLMLAGTVDQANAGALPYRLVPRILGIVDRYMPPGHS